MSLSALHCPRYRWRAPLLLAWQILLAASPSTSAAAFDFSRDTMAFPNEMHWVYATDPDGRWRVSRRDPHPSYALRCFPLTRATREFAYHARFDPAQPRLEPAEYDTLVRQVIRRPSRRVAPDHEKITIPGFADLKEFSAAHPDIVQAHAGSAISSYFKRGNWRVVFPFSRGQQARTAQALLDKLDAGQLPIVHLVVFPKMNHGILLYRARHEDGVTYFDAYDPNTPDRQLALRYYPASRAFVLPRTDYFHGGDVNVIEVYASAFF